MTRLIGDAYIVIYPQTDQFGPQLEAAVKKYTAALKPTVSVRPQLDKAAAAALGSEIKAATEGTDAKVGVHVDAASLAAVKTEMDSLISKAMVDLAINPASLAKAEGELQALHTDFSTGTKIDPQSLAATKAGMQAYLDRNIVTAPVGAKPDPVSLAAAKAGLQAYLDRNIVTAPVYTRLDPVSLAAAKANFGAFMKNSIGTLKVPAELDPARLAAMEETLKTFQRPIPVDVNDTQAIGGLDDIAERAGLVQGMLANLRANVDDTAAEAKLAALQVKTTALMKALEKAPDDADWAPFEARLLAIEAAFEKLSAAKIDLDDVQASGELTRLVTQTGDLRIALSNLRANVDDTAAEAKISALQAQAVALSRALASAPADADFAPLEAQLLTIEAAFEKLSGVKVSLNDAQASGELTQLVTQVGDLRAGLSNLRANVNGAAAQAKIAALQAQAVALSRSLSAASASADLTPLEAEVLALTASYEKLKGAVDQANTSTGRFLNTFGLQGPGSLIHITDILNASIPEFKLYGGAITAMYQKIAGGDAQLPTLASHFVAVATSAHLTAEAAIELTAVWVPATVAVAAFAAAATPTVIAVTKQLQNMNTAARGTGQSFRSLATNGQSVVAAVKPTVLELFGEALFAVQNRSSTLSQSLHALGQGIDQLGAEAAVAFDSSTGDKFFKTGTSDALALMDSFKQLGSIMGTLFKAVPGYAEVLLGFGNDVLGAAASLTKAVEPALSWGLAIHGAMLYGGLAGTAIAAAFAKILAVTTTATEAVAGWAAANLAADSTVVEGLGKVLLGMDALSATPVILGIGLLAGVIAGIAIYLKRAGNEATSFNKSIQQSISSSSLGELQSNIQSGITQTTVQYVAAQKQLAAATKTATDAQSAEAKEGRAGEAQLLNNAAAVQKAQATTASYAQGLTQLTTQQSNVNSNLQELAKTYGTSIPGALSLANGAQVTANQLTAKSAENTATLNAQVGGYLAQLRVMTAGTGTLNQALNALNVTSSAQVTDAQKLAQAYSSWIGIVTGGDTGFTNFEQGFIELNSVMSKNAADAATLYAKTGNLKDKISEYGATLNGTTQASIAARQAWDSQIQSATALYGNLQTMAAASGNTASAQIALAASGKDLVAQLLPLAKGSQEATAQVYALAQIVGYTGPDSFGSLVKWLGNTKNAEDDLNKQQTILTVSSANLTAAAKNLSAAVSQEITQAEAAAIAQTEHFADTTLKLAQAFQKSNDSASQAVITYAGKFYTSLVNAGDGAKDAQSQVDAFLTQLGASGPVIQEVNADLAKLPATNKAATLAQKAFTDATQQNLNALRAIPGALANSTSGYNQLFDAIAKEDQALIGNTSQAGAAKSAFISFAENGLHKTAAEAQALWQTQAAQNLTSLAGKAGTTESQFVQFAKNGLHLTTTEAQQLWAELRLQYLDTLVAKGKSAESQFINLAKQGLDLTTSSAQQLWNTMRNQYLDTLAGKAGETEKAFEKTANQLGVTKGAADKLWQSMHQLASGSPYNTSVNATISASGTVQAIENSSLAAGAKNSILGSLTFSAGVPAKAGGGVIKGHGPSGRDSQLIVAAPGELIVPASHAPKFADMARKASIPGFASGGLVALEPGVASTVSAIPSTVVRDEDPYAQTNIQAFVTAMKNGLVQTLSAAISLAGVSNASAVAALQSAAAKASWTGAQWTALENVEMREAGFSLTATNPTSGAYGMAQFIDGPSEYAQYGGNANTYAGQATAMVNYIKQRYGSPEAAWQHEQQFGWYSGGGLVPGGKGYSAGGMISEPVFGYGKYSGMPYAFAENGPEQVIPGGAAAVANQGLPGMTTYQANTLISLMQQQNKLLAQLPYSQAQAINQANAAGVRRGYFATSG